MVDSDTRIDVMIVGDVGCGKKTLLNQLIWPDHPTWSSHAVTSQFLCGRKMIMSIRNTCGKILQFYAVTWSTVVFSESFERSFLYY